jgi:gliding motility-associated lipoprotein GldH
MFQNQRSLRKTIFFLFAVLILNSCRTIDLYEKVVSIPGHSWQSNFKPKFTFEIKDTSSNYQVFIILRHNDKYNYNNIWLNLYAQAPGDSAKKFMLELPLANNEKGWLGSAMDDLYEHRVALTLDPQKFNFKKAGTYSFTLEQVMREDPLLNVLNAGIRLEKKSQ